MKKNNATLKSYFETGDYPTEAQFVDLIDSFLNIEEEDAVTGIADNGDGTFTFQLLSGGQVTLNGATIPDDIPIANIIGLQALLDASAPGNFLGKDQDENTTGGLSIDMAAFGDGKSFSIGAQGVAAYLSMDTNGNAVFGNASSNDGQDSSLVIKKNGSLEFNDNGTPHTVWHSGNDGAGSGLDADLINGKALSATGNRFDVLPFVAGDGVMEIGKYLDFHLTDEDASDQSGRFTLASNNEFELSGNMTIKKVTARVEAYQDSIRFGRLEGNTSGGAVVLTNANESNTTIIRGYGNSDFYGGNIYVRNGQLDITHNTDISLILKRSNSNNTGIQFGNITSDTSRIYGRSSSHAFRFFSNSDNIGNWFPNGTLEINGNILSSTQIGVTNPNNPSASSYLSWSNNNPRIRVGGTGSGASNAFEIQGTGDFLRAKFEANGDLRVSTNCYADNFILSSDKRLKTNIKPIKQQKIILNWVTFKMKGEERYGVIAQELEKAHPEFVKTDEEGYKSVAYVDLLIAKNAELETRIEKLENLIKDLI